MKFFLVLVALLAGCAAVETAPTPAPTPAPVPVPAPASVSPNTAVAELVLGARTDASAGQYAKAAASLERALRIEPRNPRLWNELARLRLKQGEYAQAESVAARSNTWAGSDNGLRADNWRIIAESRTGRGDSEGARAATAQAEKVR